MNSGAEGAENFFRALKLGNFFSPNIWQTMTSLNPLDALIPKVPFSLFCRFLGLGHLRGPGVSIGRISGSCQLSLFFWGGSSQGAQSTPAPPPPPQTKTRPPKLLSPASGVDCTVQWCGGLMPMLHGAYAMKECVMIGAATGPRMEAHVRPIGYARPPTDFGGPSGGRAPCEWTSNSVGLSDVVEVSLHCDSDGAHTAR